MSYRAALSWGFGVALLLGHNPLNATLGEKLDTVVLSKETQARKLNIQNFDTYTVHELIDAQGAKVRQYTNASGRVFAVTWEGGRLPNLQKLLGAHFDSFSKESSSKTRRRGPLVIQSGDLTVISGGHQRDFRGQASLKNLMPPNLNQEAIQ